MAVSTPVYVVLDETNEGDFETVPYGAFINLEKAEKALAKLKRADAYICEYKLETAADSVPIDIIDIVEWEGWGGPIEISIATAAGSHMDMVAQFVDNI